MHILESAAIETIAIKLFDQYNSTVHHVYTWLGVNEATRNIWRVKAEKLLTEGYYNDDR